MEGAGSYPPDNSLIGGEGKTIDSLILGAICHPQSLGHDRIEQKGGSNERNALRTHFRRTTANDRTGTAQSIALALATLVCKAVVDNSDNILVGCVLYAPSISERISDRATPIAFPQLTIYCRSGRHRTAPLVAKLLWSFLQKADPPEVTFTPQERLRRAIIEDSDIVGYILSRSSFDRRRRCAEEPKHSPFVPPGWTASLSSKAASRRDLSYPRSSTRSPIWRHAMTSAGGRSGCCSKRW